MTTHIPNRPFKNWVLTEHQTWHQLAHRQLENAPGKLSSHFFTGLKKLHLSLDTVPNFAAINHRLRETSGWSLVSTNLEFADSQTWFELLSHNQFLVTECIRPLDSLDYTPKPDVFHDGFGHLPFLPDPQISRIIRTFTNLILSSQGEQRKKLENIWWYTIEFGLIKEQGQLRAWGAGLASSFGELNQVFTGKTQVMPFDPHKIGETKESPTQFHTQLFVVDSLDQVEDMLQNWPIN